MSIQLRTCDRCLQPLTNKEVNAGWPIPVTPPGGNPSGDCEFVCSDCYGDEAWCSHCGELLSTSDDSDVCSNCKDEDDEL